MGVPAAYCHCSLGRRHIVGGAVSLIDSEGLKALTMRRLGEYLDVEAMAVHHRIKGREELLDAVVEPVIDELYADPEVHLYATDTTCSDRDLASGFITLTAAGDGLA